MSKKQKYLVYPPSNTSFWELFDYFWDNGVGNEVSDSDEPVAWSAVSLESALGHDIDVRSIQNWRSRKFIPTRENIRKLSWVISDGDHDLRQSWSDALIAAWREEKRNNRETSPPADLAPDKHPVATSSRIPMSWLKIGVTSSLLLAGGIAWFVFGGILHPSVKNIRICDAPYFNKDTKDCTKHVSVFVEGIEEVFLSFDFENLPKSAPFERWWIRNGERVTGRTSFNDEAWPGYTYWRPGGAIPFGQYVVRIVVDKKVFTQTFQIQKEAFNIEK